VDALTKFKCGTHETVCVCVCVSVSVSLSHIFFLGFFHTHTHLTHASYIEFSVELTGKKHHSNTIEQFSANNFLKLHTLQ